MKLKDINYSLKNIPAPNQESYMKILIDKTEHFLKRLRWKAIFFLQSKRDEEEIDVDTVDSDPTPCNKYGFKSINIPESVKELVDFEKDLWNLVDSITFSNKLNPFQKQLKRDIKEIKNSKNLFIKADKTRNVYEVEPVTYDKLLKENITQKYKKDIDNSLPAINKEAYEIASNLNIAERVEQIAKCEAFITLKDHKPNFSSAPQCRLINPAKSQIGRISKQMLENINNEIRRKTMAQQWRSTDEMLDWFKNIENKEQFNFIQIDIVEFYPSITSELLNEAIAYAQIHTNVDDLELKAIFNSRKSLLFNDEEIWVKKDSTFDVSMGAYDGAEISELVGLLILNKTKEAFPEINFGLYRDDGLGVYKDISGRARDQIRKKLIAMFKDLGLKITVEFGLKTVNFLDVTLNLNENSFKQYRKPNDPPCYINKNSNHPPAIVKEIPKMVNKRLSKISSDRKVFEESTHIYKEALKKSGYKHEFKYQNEMASRKKRKKKDLIYYNPPFNTLVKTNIGKQFLNLIDKHFKKQRKDNLNKIINRHTVKISYSCTNNMASIISSHNRKQIQNLKNKENQNKKNNDKQCNCRVKKDCPLEGKCFFKEGAVYKATVKTAKNETQTYVGSAENFKRRYYTHNSDFRNEKYRNSTALSAFIWEQKDNNTSIEIKWEILKKCHAYVSGMKRCDLCLAEKLIIMKQPGTLNKRSELMSTCRHKTRFKLNK